MKTRRRSTRNDAPTSKKQKVQNDQHSIATQEKDAKRASKQRGTRKRDLSKVTENEDALKTETKNVKADEKWTVQLDSYGLKLNPCSRKQHLHKRNCSWNPNCLYGLGERKDGIWAKNPTLLSGLRPLSETELRTGAQKEPCGLVNQGATCYMNVLLQCLFMNSGFRHAVYNAPLNDDVPHLLELQKVFARLQLSVCKVQNLNSLAKVLKIPTWEQQDATEFTNLFLKRMSSLTEMFQGEQTHITRCERCQKSSARAETFVDLSLQVSASVSESLVHLGKKELLSGVNQYRCDNCNKLTDAQRWCRVSKLPPVLNLLLMRYVYDVSTASRKKVKSKVQIPMFVDFGKLDGVVLEESKCEKYRLVGVLDHIGASALNGHYTAALRHPEKGTWWTFDDTTVTPFKQNDKTHGDPGGSKTAYMLVYMRQDLADQSKPCEVPESLRKIVEAENALAQKEHDDNLSLHSRFKEEIKERKTEYETIFLSCQSEKNKNTTEQKQFTTQQQNVRVKKAGGKSVDIKKKKKSLAPQQMKENPYCLPNDEDGYLVPTEWLKKWVCGKEPAQSDVIDIDGADGIAPIFGSAVKKKEPEKLIQSDVKENKSDEINRADSKVEPEVQVKKPKKNNKKVEERSQLKTSTSTSIINSDHNLALALSAAESRKRLRRRNPGRKAKDDTATEKKIKQILSNTTSSRSRTRRNKKPKHHNTNTDLINDNPKCTSQQNTSHASSKTVEDSNNTIQNNTIEKSTIEKNTIQEKKENVVGLEIDALCLKKFICKHGQQKNKNTVSPLSMRKLKRVSENTWNKFVEYAGSFDVALKVKDMHCSECVEEIVERNAEIEKDSIVWETISNMLQQAPPATTEEHALISRQWISKWKDWNKQRCAKLSKSHELDVLLPCEDTGSFFLFNLHDYRHLVPGEMKNINKDLECEHGGLKPGMKGKRLLAVSEFTYIKQNAFSGTCESSTEYTTNTIECKICQNRSTQLLEEKHRVKNERELQMKDAVHGAVLRRVFKRVRKTPTTVDGEVVCIVPQKWLNSWRHYLNGAKPEENKKPPCIIQNIKDVFYCKHDCIVLCPTLIRWARKKEETLITTGSDDDCEVITKAEYNALVHFNSQEQSNHKTSTNQTKQNGINTNQEPEQFSTENEHAKVQDGDKKEVDVGAEYCISLDFDKSQDMGENKIALKPSLCAICMVERWTRYEISMTAFENKVFEAIRLLPGQFSGDDSNGVRRSKRSRISSKSKFTVVLSDSDHISLVRLKLLQALNDDSILLSQITVFNKNKTKITDGTVLANKIRIGDNIFFRVSDAKEEQDDEVVLMGNEKPGKERGFVGSLLS